MKYILLVLCYIIYMVNHMFYRLQLNLSLIFKSKTQDYIWYTAHFRHSINNYLDILNNNFLSKNTRNYKKCIHPIVSIYNYYSWHHYKCIQSIDLRIRHILKGTQDNFLSRYTIKIRNMLMLLNRFLTRQSILNIFLNQFRHKQHITWCYTLISI